MKTYASKILLAGEYTVLLDSDALAIPFSYYFGGWRKGVRNDYPFELEDWIAHLKSLSDDGINLDAERMVDDYEQDIRFVSNVPHGGGLGSSGAVTAAFYDRYMYTELSPDKDLEEIQRILAEMEAYFHGQSSGIDPLVSLTNRTYVRLNNRGSLHDLDVPDSISLHIITTTSDRQTAPLIEQFNASMKKKAYAGRVKKELIPAVHSFVSGWLEGRMSQVESAFKDISRLEWELCSPMIAKEIRKLWKAGLDSDQYSIKLCGAGGGGAYLALGTLPEDLDLKTRKVI